MGCADQVGGVFQGTLGKTVQQQMEETTETKAGPLIYKVFGWVFKYHSVASTSGILSLSQLYNDGVFASFAQPEEKLKITSSHFFHYLQVSMQKHTPIPQ